MKYNLLALWHKSSLALLEEHEEEIKEAVTKLFPEGTDMEALAMATELRDALVAKEGNKLEEVAAIYLYKVDESFCLSVCLSA